ncbi:transcriptional regulator [Leptospira stimsonii]|uniref:Transcriptional regulator n=2 Tax=Leptospira stimsonii TaxID=2202203 RepID=A0A8B3CM14_9LEPT|nr:transcriptional regulator [Leptospira stimsonii]
MTEPEALKRLKLVFEYLKKEHNLNQANVAKAFGVGDSALTRIRTGENSLTNRVLIQFETIYGISANWILKGEGEMMLPSLESRMDEDQKFLKMIDSRTGFREIIKTLSKLSDKNLLVIKSLAENLDPDQK